MKTRQLILGLIGLMILSSCGSGFNNFNKRKYTNLKTKNNKYEMTSSAKSIEAPVRATEDFYVADEESYFENSEVNETPDETINVQENHEFYSGESSESNFDQFIFDKVEVDRTAGAIDNTEREEASEPIEETYHHEFDEALYDRKINTYENWLIAMVSISLILLLMGALVIAGFYFPPLYAFTGVMTNFFIFWIYGLVGAIFGGFFAGLKARRWTKRAKRSYSDRLKALWPIALGLFVLGAAAVAAVIGVYIALLGYYF